MTAPRMVIAAYDAGGAEIIASWLAPTWNPREARTGSTQIVAGGPAFDVFRARLGEPPIYGRVPALDSARLVLCGSSGRSPLERTVIRAARAAGAPSAVWLDHYKNYAERLEELPDVLWVCDAYARDLAERTFPGVPVAVKGNPYADEIAITVRKLDLERGRSGGWPEHVLWVCEPGRSSELLEFQREVEPDQTSGRVSLRIRPHPSEARAASSLAEDLAWADRVVGCESMALVYALAAGRRAISVLPDPCLPQPEIERASSRSPRSAL